MNVAKLTRAAEVAASSAAVKPAAGPPIERATHQAMGITIRLSNAISPTTQVGSPLPSQAAGRSRS